VKRVLLAPAAYRDLTRLSAWLSPKSPRAADRAADAMLGAITSLAEMSDRGTPLRGRIRELAVEFGRDGYVLRYRSTESLATVTRIFHARERR
jgi:plasmid stabilization system protein ParE